MAALLVYLLGVGVSMKIDAAHRPMDARDFIITLAWPLATVVACCIASYTFCRYGRLDR